MKTIIIDGIEYNLTPKVLFKKGDFVVIQETTYLISKIEGLNVTLSCNGRECLFDIDVLKNARLWDITKDAKDGDVLVDVYGNIGIYEECDDFDWKSYCSLGVNGGFQNFEVEHENDKTHPATKEQRDTLMKAIADAGYTFDFEKKELKKIVQTPVEWHREDEQNLNACLGYIPDEFLRRWLMDAIHTKYDKPAEWSEKDELQMNAAIDICKNLGYTPTSDWLKSLKLRNHWKPTEEQVEAFEHFVRSIGESGYASPYENNTKLLYSLLNDLEKLIE